VAGRSRGMLLGDREFGRDRVRVRVDDHRDRGSELSSFEHVSGPQPSRAHPAADS
jgi:hypothetical protein